MRRTRRFVFCGSGPWVWLLALALMAGPAEAKEVTLTIFHTNDIHQTLDNLSRIACYVKACKAKDPNTMFVDAGDYFDRGSSLVPLTRGEALYGAMSRMGYDAWIVGNHDWTYGPDRLLELMRLHPTRVLGTSLVFKEGTRPSNVVTTWMPEFDGIRVGFLGIGLGGTRPNTTLYRTDAAAAARSGIEELEKKGADLIVAVTHIGAKTMKHEKPGKKFTDIELAKAFPAIDIIVGGHTHSLICGEATRKLREETGAIIVQAGARGRLLGRLSVTVDDGTRKISAFDATSVLIEKTMPEDPEVASYLKAFYDKHMPDAKTVIAVFEEKTEFHNFGCWFADFLRREAEADIAIVPRKALYDEPRSFAQGERTVEEFCALIRDRHVVKWNVPGATLLDYLSSEKVRDYLNPFHHGKRPFSGDAYYYSGMNVTYNPDQDSVAIDLDPAKTYSLVTVWPFLRRAARKYRHALAPREKAVQKEYLPGLPAKGVEVLDKTTWELVAGAGKKQKLTIRRTFAKPPAEWKTWTKRFEAKLAGGGAK